MLAHLQECQSYLEDPANKASWIVAEYRRNHSKGGIKSSFTKGFFEQTMIDAPTLRDEQQKRLEDLAAQAIFAGGRPLNLFQCPYMSAFIRELNPAFKIPSYSTFKEALLDRSYEECKQKVEKEVLSSSYLNFISDGSSNVSYNRMENLSVQTHSGIYQLEHFEIDAIKHDARTIAEWINERALYWAGGVPERINSLSTDTENKMRSVWTNLKGKPAWDRAFFVPCDSHGIQLLLKHICELDWFRGVLKKSQQIVSYFHKSLKQLAILRSEQISQYGKTLALILSIITRWGTQFRLLNSLLRSKQALRAWAIHPGIDCEPNEERKQGQTAVIESINKHAFWADLEDLREIIAPIYNEQVMSEDNRAHLGYVLQRWKRIKNHLQTLQHRTGFTRSDEIAEIFADRYDSRTGNPVPSVWDTQFKKQVLDIHLVAFHLDPANHNIECSADEIRIIHQFLNEHTFGGADEQRAIRKQFMNFKRQKQDFLPLANCWADQDDMEAFWYAAPDAAHTWVFC